MAFNNILGMFTPWNKRDEEENDKKLRNNLDSITSPKFDDGAREYETTENELPYNAFNQQLYGAGDVEIKNTADLINTYRCLIDNYEVDNAVDEIVSDSIVYEDGHDVVSLDLEDTKFNPRIKELIQEEFKNVLKVLQFRRKGADHFKRWYTDSRIFFHKIVDINNLDKGIQEMRRLDPRNVQYVREVITKNENGTKIVTGYRDYFIYDTGAESYNDGFRIFSAGSKIKIPRSAITYAHSGIVDSAGRNIIGYLHRAVKPANQLKLLEDAMVIYRITRAPDRRVFYIDTGQMPSKKAAQHMQNIMNGMKNRIVYDASTGKIKNQQHNMSMTEDYWLQRRDGKAATDVDTLPGASGMNEMDDVKWFKRCLYMALRIPLTRIPDDSGGGVQFDMGTAITRDEIKFDVFIRSLQHKFEEVFLDPLKTNLLLKSIIDEGEWNDEINNIKIAFHRNSYFTEMKDAEITERRINSLQQAEPFIGKYISHQTAMRSYLQMTDEEILEERRQIELEKKDSLFNDNFDEPNEEF